MKAVVIIPTYNERENILALLSAVQAVVAGSNWDTEILVVDDSSPDGTAEVVKEVQQKAAGVHLLVGEKRGFGAAHVRGIRHALEELSADAVIQMDADFSHSPQDVPRLLVELDAGYDFVIGSRWVDASKLPSNWSFVRRNVSRLGNLCIRYIAGLQQIHDCTNGFRAINADLLRRMDMTRKWPEGYAFLVTHLYEAIQHGGRTKEIPAQYVDRTRGKSKLGLKELFHSSLNILGLRVGRIKELLRFGR